MKFSALEIEFEKYQSVDIIAASPEDPTQGTTQPTQNTDPYESDKW